MTRETFFGLPVHLSPWLPRDVEAVVLGKEPSQVVVYRDRAALMRALFWANVRPRLDAVAAETERAVKAL